MFLLVNLPKYTSSIMLIHAPRHRLLRIEHVSRLNYVCSTAFRKEGRAATMCAHSKPTTVRPHTHATRSDSVNVDDTYTLRPHTHTTRSDSVNVDDTYTYKD